MIPGGLLVALAVLVLLRAGRKREIAVGRLIYHREKRCGGSLIVTEEVTFNNQQECMQHYHQLVFQLYPSAKGYALDSWTYNRFDTSGETVELFRFGKCIKLKKTVAKHPSTKQGRV